MAVRARLGPKVRERERLGVRAEAAVVSVRVGARGMWRRVPCAVCTCTGALLEGDVIDEAARVDVRRIRLRRGTYVKSSPGLDSGYGSGYGSGCSPECGPGLGVRLGVGLGAGIAALGLRRWDCAAAHGSEEELAPAMRDVVELVARHLARVRAGAGGKGRGRSEGGVVVVVVGGGGKGRIRRHTGLAELDA